jgi:hypothetical protein
MMGARVCHLWVEKSCPPQLSRTMSSSDTTACIICFGPIRGGSQRAPSQHKEPLPPSSSHIHPRPRPIHQGPPKRITPHDIHPHIHTSFLFWKASFSAASSSFSRPTASAASPTRRRGLDKLRFLEALPHPRDTSACCIYQRMTEGWHCV